MLNSPPPGGAPAAVNRQLPQALSASGSQQQGIGQGTSNGNVPGGLSGYSGIYSGQPAPAGPPPNANANGIAGFGQTPIPNINGMLTTPPPASPQGFGSPFPGGQGYSDFSGTGAPGSPFAGGQGYSNMAPGLSMAGGQGNAPSYGSPFPGGQGYSGQAPGGSGTPPTFGSPFSGGQGYSGQTPTQGQGFGSSFSGGPQGYSGQRNPTRM